MQGPRLVLLRHGQGMLGSGQYDRLSETGKIQALRLGQRIYEELPGPWAVWSGALRRQRETLSRLAVSGPTFIDPCLNEYRVDHLVRNALAQAETLRLSPPPQAAFADPVRFLDTFMGWFPGVLECWQSGRLDDPCNGTWTAFRSRVLLPLSAWETRLRKGRSVVVVTSAGVISTLVASLCGQDLCWQRQFNVSLYNASVTELALDGHGQWRYGRLNCVSHLQEEGLQTLA